MEVPMDNVQAIARSATRRVATFVVGAVIAAGLLASIGGAAALTGDHGLRAAPGHEVTVLAAPSESKRWAPAPPRRGGGGCGNCK
jgi:hypothetical protein